jgi:hypothetical protein
MNLFKTEREASVAATPRRPNFTIVLLRRISRESAPANPVKGPLLGVGCGRPNQESTRPVAMVDELTAHRLPTKDARLKPTGPSLHADERAYSDRSPRCRPTKPSLQSLGSGPPAQRMVANRGVSNFELKIIESSRISKSIRIVDGMSHERKFATLSLVLRCGASGDNS